MLCKTIKTFYSDFDDKKFFETVFDEMWHTKELKQRMRHISKTLGDFIPNSYKDSINILILVFQSLSDKRYLENMIFQDFVEVYGLDDFKTSMKALEVFTVDSSSEFAIRQFILKYPKETMQQMETWTQSSNEHHRRLASEGSRSRLPWACALNDFKKDPSDVIDILEILKDDSSEYVRKSVANNLNDISKDNPDIVKDLASRWIGHSKQRDALLKHGCRTLLKESDREILNLFGFENTAEISLKNFTLNSEVEWGGELEFSFDIVSEKTLGKLRIEYILEFLRQNSKYSKKVFKIQDGEYDTSIKSVTKKHSFREISTRKYYAGVQKISVVINGKVYANAEFSILS